jgi:hypothetical protein
MDPFVTIQYDEHSLSRLRAVFARWPGAVPKIMKESINATSDKARTSIVRRVQQYMKGFRAKDIRARIKQRKATLDRWESTLRISSKGLPITKMGFKQGRVKKVYFEATSKQSVWLYHNVFKPKYGDAAVFSTKYRIARKSYPNMTYQVMGKTVSVTTPGAFIQTVKNKWAADGAAGHKGVFVTREGYGGKALSEVFGPGLGTMLQDQKGELQAVEREAFATLEDNINRRVARYTQMMLRRAG